MKNCGIYVFVLGILSCHFAAADDWPMWRGNASRGGIVTADPPASLNLQWVRQFRQPQAAWPASQSKLQFDAVLAPIVVGRHLIVASNENDSVAAYDTATGKQAWRFFTEGPVRLAPAAADGSVCVGGDDGWLYCLDAQSGELNWKFQGGPSSRKIIGNDRLISTWPVRGGPVIADGTVYFTAGIWPFMGVFVHAVDLQSGEVKWTNSETGSSWITHPHGAPSFGSIAPQGYLAVAGDYLIVPGGRSLPAVFDRRTGKLKHFDFGGKSSGGWRVLANDGLFSVGGESFALSDRSQVGRASIDLLSNTTMISARKLHRLKSGVVADEKTVDRRGKEIIEKKLSIAESTPLELDGYRPLAIAGDALFAAKESTIARFSLAAVSDEKSPAAPTWSEKVAAEIADVVVGDDRLFVVTADARIVCFGETAATSVFNHEPSAATSEKQVPKNAPLVSNVDWANVQSGYAVCVGLDRSVIDQVISQTKLQLIAIDSDSDAIAEFREEMASIGLYGHRVAAWTGSPNQLEFPPYFAKLIVVAEPATALSDASVKQLAHSLRPYGGQLIVGKQLVDHDVLKEIARDLTLEISAGEATISLTRSGPLPGAGSWTHQYADAGNSVVSQDKRVKAPLGVLWFGGPPTDRVLPRHGHGPSPQVAGGRLIIEGADMLRAVDVYTGEMLWERDLPGLGEYYNVTRHFAGAGEIGSNYTTLADAIYVVYKSQILELNPDDGSTRRTFDLDSPDGAWGRLAVIDNVLIATSSPVRLADSKTNKAATKPKGDALVAPAAEWLYIAGEDPPKDWMTTAFKTSDAWKTGKSGFGYGDDDDRTILKNMRGSYQRVYLRTKFVAKNVSAARGLSLLVNYDDAFIAYLNGKEILRVGVKKGSGADAKDIASHESKGSERFSIADFRKLLVEGENTLAIEGHNVSLTSSDFSLEPSLWIERSGPSTDDTVKQQTRVDDVLQPARYSSNSKRLVVFDRNDGKELWSRTAKFSFRHNSIAAADGVVYCIDGMSEEQLAQLKRRGAEITAKPQLLALNAQTGDEIWSTNENVFGTFLSYSPEHQLLLQAGSAYRDRAADEVSKGMVAYRAKDGEVVWQDLSRSYGGPCLLWKDKIITNGGGGSMFELLTGKQVDWKYTRMYGCNTAVGSQNLLTFRSGAAGYFDLAGDSGTGNFGGFRSSCTANLIVADGVLNAPDYTRTCVCAYQNQCSLALIHTPNAEMWTFSSLSESPQQFGLNLGAPGDRRDSNGTLWYDAPAVGGKSPTLPMKLAGEIESVRRHASTIETQSTDAPAWIAATAVVGLTNCEQQVSEKAAADSTFNVQLHFAELEYEAAGERLFDVRINGKTVLSDFDIFDAAGGANRSLRRNFQATADDGKIRVEFVAKKGKACCSGIAIVAE